MKVKEWSYCVAHHHTLEVRTPVLKFSVMCKTCTEIASLHNQSFVRQYNKYSVSVKSRYQLYIELLTQCGITNVIPHLLCGFLDKVEIMFVLSPSDLLVVCLCC